MDSQEADSGREDGRRKSRRAFVRTVGVAGVGGMLAGCSTSTPGADGNESNGGTTGGTSGDTGGDVTVNIAATSVEANNKQGFLDSLREGGLPENIDISFLATSDISGNVQSQYRSWLQTGREDPDILRMDSGWTIPFIKRGQLVNLSERLPSETLSGIEKDYFGAAVKATTGQGGDLYGVPYQVGLPTIQYRKDLVKQAGYDPDGNNWATEPISWKKFSEVIAKAKQESGMKYGYSWQAKNYVGLSCCTFNELISTWGGAYFGGMDTLFGPVGERPVTVDEEPVINALKMGRSFIHGPDGEHALEGYKKISPTDVLQWTEGPSKSQFIDGNAIALRYWPSAIPDAADEFGDKLGLMPIPFGVQPSESKYENLGGTAAALGGWNMTLNPHSTNKDAAIKVLDALTSQPFRQFQLKTLDLLPPDTAALSQKQLQDVPVWGKYADTIKVAGENAVPRPVTSVWPDQSSAIAERVNAVLAGQQAPDSGMSELKSTLEQLENSTS